MCFSEGAECSKRVGMVVRGLLHVGPSPASPGRCTRDVAITFLVRFTPRDRLYSQLHTASHFQAMQSDVTGSSIAEGGSGPAEAAAITAMPVEVELGAAEPSPARSSEDGTHV